MPLGNADRFHCYHEIGPAGRNGKQSGREGARRCHEDGMPFHSVRTLLAELATIVRNTCGTFAENNGPPFTVTRNRTRQCRALDVIDQQMV